MTGPRTGRPGPGEDHRYHDFRTEEIVTLEPLPCWKHLPPSEIQERVRHMLREIEDETAERHRRNGTRPMGRKPAQQVHPHDSPASPKRGPRPAVHAATQEIREAMKQAYREFAAFFRAAAQDLGTGPTNAQFPQEASHRTYPTSLPKPPPRSRRR